MFKLTFFYNDKINLKNNKKVCVFLLTPLRGLSPNFNFANFLYNLCAINLIF